MVMKIENYEGTANTFTWPHNPNVLDVQTTNFVDPREYAYAFGYFGVTNPIKSKQSGVIAGHFDGTNKESHYRSLAEHFNSNKLKKLYFGSDKFMIVIPQGIKRTYTGGRTNFIDYVATFTSPFGILFDDTQKDGAYNGTGDDNTNEGNVSTPIEKITGTVTGGSKVTITDKKGNGFTLTARGSGTVDFQMLLITMENVGSDNYITSYLQVETDSTITAVKTANISKSMLLRLDSNEDLDTRFNTGYASIVGFSSGPTFYWRDGWSGD